MGFLTNLLNPKIAVMYLSLLPQFLHPQGHGSVLMQSLVLGFTQIAVNVSVNAVIEVLPLAWASGWSQSSRAVPTIWGRRGGSILRQRSPRGADTAQCRVL